METRDEAVLERLRKGASGRKAFKSQLVSVASSVGEVRELTPKVTLEVTDFDPTDTPEEVIEGMERASGMKPRGLHIFPLN